jgi:hypothetical protein
MQVPELFISIPALVRVDLNARWRRCWKSDHVKFGNHLTELIARVKLDHTYLRIPLNGTPEKIIWAFSTTSNAFLKSYIVEAQVKRASEEDELVGWL